MSTISLIVPASMKSIVFVWLLPTSPSASGRLVCLI